MADKKKEKMKRYYGVIEAVTAGENAALRFINDLSEAIKDGSRNAGFGDAEFIGHLSEYARAAEEYQRMQDAIREGIINEAVSPDAAELIRKELTNTDEGEEGEQDAVIALSSNLFLIVRPIRYEYQVTHIARMFIKHIYVDEETQEVSTTIFDFGSQNSNGRCPAIAYEITQTDGGDALVKLAWCPAYSYNFDENDLPDAMAAQSINCYVARVDHASHQVIFGHAGAGHKMATHTNVVYGEDGVIGGFVVHRMKDTNTAGSKFGISVFSTNGTPLYTWCANSKPWNALDPETETAKYLNIPDLGRKIAPPDEDGYTPVKMTVLAPIITPAVATSADTAKWMQTGIHVYSYFDNSGHIRLLGKQFDTAFFVDHGVCLNDGNDVANRFTASNRMLPTSNPANMIVPERPNITDKISFAEDYSGYFDADAGLSSSKWMSVNDTSDMLLVGSPKIGTDPDNGHKFVTFRSTDTEWSYGTLPFHVDLNHTKNGESLVGVPAPDRMFTVVLVAGRLSLTLGNQNYIPMTSLTRNSPIVDGVNQSYIIIPIKPFGDEQAGRIGRSGMWTEYRNGTLDRGPTMDDVLPADGTRFVMAILFGRPSGSGYEQPARWWMQFENGASINRNITDNAGCTINTNYESDYNFNLNAINFAEPRKGYGAPVTGGDWINGQNKEFELDVYFAAIGNGIMGTGDGTAGSTDNRIQTQLNDLKTKYFKS